MTALAFVDCETTGLDPDRHEVWEVALILRGDDDPEKEFVWQLPVDLSRADSVALSIGQFYERSRQPGPPDLYKTDFERRIDFAAEFSQLTHGAHLVGAVPSFDDAFLKRLLRANGACPGWHYHLIDVEALAAGHLAGQRLMGYHHADVVPPADWPSMMLPPWKSDALSRAVGIEPDDYDRHTALGDAKWARAIYDAVMCW